jgi:flagellar motor switch protein FliG
MAETGVTVRPPRPPMPRVTGLEKAAILLMTLGPEAAAGVFRHLSEHNVREISAAMARLRMISHEQAAAVHEEAWRRLTNRDGLFMDGEQFARQVLTSVLPAGARGGMREMKRATQSGAEILAATLEPVPPAALAQVLAGEHPQVTALTVAALPPRQAAQVLGALPEAMQADIVHRITDMQNVSDDVLAEVGDALQGKVSGLGRASQGAPVGGTRVAAAILNAVDETVEQRVFSHLETAAPDMVETIRGLMFTFEDLIQLDNRGLQVVLKEVPREDLMLALKTASPALKEKIFGNLSQRAAEILKEDMSTMGPVRLKEVEKAQANIIAVVRRLEAEQKIVIGGGTGGDVVV